MNPVDLITSVLATSDTPIMTTSFGPHSAVLLHMITTIKPDITTVWIDTQFATPETLLHKQILSDLLNLNLHTVIGTEWVGDIPTTESEFDAFADQIKLTPFKSVMSTLQPSHWFSSVRREETTFRSQLEHTTTVDNLVKVSPLLTWTTLNLNNYIKEHKLPTYTNYYDPLKVTVDCECGIHTMEKFK